MDHGGKLARLSVAMRVDVPGAAEAVKNLVRSGDLVLLKASRAMGLEQIGDVLRRKR